MATLSISSNMISTSFLLSSSCLLSLFLLICFSSKGFALDGGDSLQSHHHIIQVSSLLPATVCSPSAEGHDSERASSLKIVHRHGPCTPPSQQKPSAPPTITEFLSRDQARVNSIQARVRLNSGRTGVDDSEEAKIPAKKGSSLGTGNYVVTVGLGTPKRDLSLVFDTGSDLTWTQCQPCVSSCYQQQEKIFDPASSNSYRNITCSSTQCSQLTAATGNRPSCSGANCVYGIQYGDSSYSVGFLATEKLTLTAADVFPNFVFGCGEKNRGLFGATAGLLGLGRNQLSVVSQTASKFGKYFSYCLPSMSSSNGFLKFGRGAASTTVKFTPLSPNSQGPSFYFIDVKALNVGGKTLPISQSAFATAGTIIDSGTVITRLPPAAYSSLRTTFRQLMTAYPMAPALSILDTCYDLRNYETVKIPSISFVLGGNVETPVSPSGILYGRSASQLCLAFAGNGDPSDVGILGNVQQQTLEVVYDVAGGKLGLGPGGCS